METLVGLKIAAANGDTNKVKELIRRGAPVDTRLGVSNILPPILRVVIQAKFVLMFICACAKGHLEPTHLKSSPLFTLSTRSLGPDSPSIHLFSKIIRSRFTTGKVSWVKIHQADLFFLGQDSLSNKENNKTIKCMLVQDSPCFKYY